MSLSIVIVNWNSKDFVRKCLQSIERHEQMECLQIIVVDGGSFDGCGEMLAQEFPAVEFIQSPENIGFGRCNNLGVERADGEFLLLLNPDTELIEPTFRSMVALHRELPRAGILCPRLHLSDGSLQTSSVQAAPTPLNQALGSDFLHQRFPNSKLWGTGEAYRALKPVSVEAVSGAFMLMRTDVFREIGGFNPIYFMYAEDMDLCLQVRRFGLKNYHIPTIKVVHHGGGSSSTQFSRFSTVMMREALHTYMRINHGRIRALAYRIAMFGFGTARIFGLTLKKRVKPGRQTKNSLEKWSAIVSWSLGAEKWTQTHQAQETTMLEEEPAKEREEIA